MRAVREYREAQARLVRIFWPAASRQPSLHGLSVFAQTPYAQCLASLPAVTPMLSEQRTGSKAPSGCVPQECGCTKAKEVQVLAVVCALNKEGCFSFYLCTYQLLW